MIDVPEHWRYPKSRLLLTEKKQIDFKIPDEYNDLVISYKKFHDSSFVDQSLKAMARNEVK